MIPPLCADRVSQRSGRDDKVLFFFVGGPGGAGIVGGETVFVAHGPDGSALAIFAVNTLEVFVGGAGIETDFDLAAGPAAPGVRLGSEDNTAATGKVIRTQLGERISGG